MSDELKLALFIDLENLAIGVQSARYKKFDIEIVLERLLEKGKIVVKRAYADWDRYSEYKRDFHEEAIDLIEIPHRSLSGKNSADIRLVVDALDMCHSKSHIDVFVVASGDSDFSPLVSKLKENNKGVVGMGVKNSSSRILIDNCDEFIFYEDLMRERTRQPQTKGKAPNLPEKKQEAFDLMLDAILALQRENKDVMWGSMVKQTMQRKKPSFNEEYHGYSSFSRLLEDAERNGLIRLRRDQRSGTYVIDEVTAD